MKVSVLLVLVACLCGPVLAEEEALPPVVKIISPDERVERRCPRYPDALSQTHRRKRGSLVSTRESSHFAFQANRVSAQGAYIILA